MDQFYISYNFTLPPSTPPFQPLPTPIISSLEFLHLQSQSEKIHLSTLVRSYISSILIALRLHPNVVSTSISSRAVRDIRNLICVSAAALGKKGRLWTNAEDVPRAVELCT